MTLKACLRSMRLRTLPLSLSGVYVGLSIALWKGGADAATAVFLVLTTICLQVISNLSNELGDVQHGTDTEQRQGMHYSIQEGEMTVSQMKNLIMVMVGICVACGLTMIYFSFGTLSGLEPALFACLGLCAIVAAMKYTLGKNPYGYRGRGDFYVFIFFGLVSTVGSCYICAHELFLPESLLPACSIGFLSMGVLNVNNIRDMKTDAATRVTVALKLGAANARRYQTVLICAGWVMMGLFTLMEAGSAPVHWLYFITLPLFVIHLRGVWTREDRALDGMLPLLVISTFLMTLIMGTSLWLFG